MPKKLHKCAVQACVVQIPLDKFLCVMHWEHVPQNLRRELNMAYANFKASGPMVRDRLAAGAWLRKAQKDIVDAVWKPL